ncbi:MAG: hypothetical protein ACP5JG_02400 [Anaerolineae bacterium]
MPRSPDDGEDQSRHHGAPNHLEPIQGVAPPPQLLGERPGDDSDVISKPTTATGG